MSQPPPQAAFDWLIPSLVFQPALPERWCRTRRLPILPAQRLQKGGQLIRDARTGLLPASWQSARQKTGPAPYNPHLNPSTDHHV